MKTADKYGVRRFCEYGDRGNDRRCFELYEIHTGKCASFPGIRRDLERHARELNSEERAPKKVEG
jgi:hypothetical protein